MWHVGIESERASEWEEVCVGKGFPLFVCVSEGWGVSVHACMKMQTGIGL